MNTLPFSHTSLTCAALTSEPKRHLCVTGDRYLISCCSASPSFLIISGPPHLPSLQGGPFFLWECSTVSKCLYLSFCFLSTAGCCSALPFIPPASSSGINRYLEWDLAEVYKDFETREGNFSIQEKQHCIQYQTQLWPLSNHKFSPGLGYCPETTWFGSHPLLTKCYLTLSCLPRFQDADSFPLQ